MRPSGGMARSPIALLVTRDAGLALSMKEVVRGIDRLEIEVVAGLEEATGLAGRVAAVLIHPGNRVDPREILGSLGPFDPARSPAPIVAILDDHDPAVALSLMKAGVADCLGRPLDLGRVGYLLEMLTMTQRFHAKGESPRSRPADGGDPDGFATDPGSRMGRLMEQVRRIAPQDSTVLLGGETGTGKTRLAGLIHGLSPRADRPFLVINCGALSSTLIESEMFGHARGAFTGADLARVGKFAEVGRGTLFLDEVDSLPLDLQAKLLRVVEERVFEPVGSNRSQPMEARLIAASNRPLDRQVAAGRFRADLFYRLNVIHFEVPPLRDRVEVIAPLARRFLAEFARRTGRDVWTFEPAAMAALEAHDWPGNVREFRNVIERAVALGSGPVVRVDDLPEAFHPDLGRPAPPRRIHVDLGAASVAPESLTLAKESAERSRISQALVLHRNNRLRAAAELGISRMTLYNKLRKYNIP